MQHDAVSIVESTGIVLNLSGLLLFGGVTGFAVIAAGRPSICNLLTCGTAHVDD